ncbi:hypothetical protein AVW11_03895 [Streptomyces amritsarensis]|uniref:Uncharacterized protein n=1 Tax=Streptomyces amritsarensis TaxID=681158 RepID=A0ABX3GBR3_9ACTN|nr:hypothetical protein [Streptomyces amritsarensis]OLZ72543.1 hypothetical protein AVW11_03895 [Streptomyces amritsarensis]
MTDTPIEDAATPPSVEDLAERFRIARARRAEIALEDRSLKAVEKDVVWTLYEGRTWKQVGEILGFTGSRAEAIARSR